MSDLAYDLPESLIAQHPPPRREDARLLVIKRSDGSQVDDAIGHLPAYLAAGDLLVLNNTKVLPAKFVARRQSGGKVEGLFLEEDSDGNWLVMLKGARRLREGEPLALVASDGATNTDDRIDVSVRVLRRLGDGKWRLNVSSCSTPAEILHRFGRTPLPPYIKRLGSPQEEEEDRSRYQTIYAEAPGAIAAPTAGLHLTSDILDGARSRGVGVAFLTLHVGIGTFKPITAERLVDHRMHLERYNIPAQTAAAIRACKDGGGRVVAVGTTTCRALESAGAELPGMEPGGVAHGWNSTDIFIYPPYRFRVVDALLTNFHLPKSTLLAMLFAFAGTSLVQRTYRHAVESRYRFFSYGDAMLIL